MLTLVIIGTALAVGAGLATKLVLSKTSLRGEASITGTEFVIGSLICALLLIPAVTGLGLKIARADQATFNEYWSGMEKTADVHTTTCTRDGSCTHEYDCDPYTETYTVQVPYTTTETYSKPGGGMGTRSVTHYRTETRTRTVYHHCPYVDAEYTYSVSDTLGQTYTMGSHWFPTDPQSHRWRGTGWNEPRWGNGLPNVSSGQPALWTAAKARIDAGAPGGTTSVHSYKNYILASQDDIYAKASSAIAAYSKAGLLPKPATGTYDYYRADKVYFVGTAPANAKDWQDAVLRFNGTFGAKSQGDFHLVLVNTAKVTNPDEYAHAIQAYWQSEALGKNALSKNGYVVVAGTTDGKTIAWARGFSGMPVGNESIDVKVRSDITGTAFTPEALIGTPTSKSTDGTLAHVVLGFKRVHMEDFKYLYTQIDASTGQKIVILIIGFLLALLVWGVFVAIDVRAPKALRDAWEQARREKNAEKNSQQTQRSIDAELDAMRDHLTQTIEPPTPTPWTVETTRERLARLTGRLTRR